MPKPTYLGGFAAIARLAVNPSHTASVFALTDGLRTLFGLEQRVLEVLRARPADALMLDERYDGPSIDLHALGAMPEGSLGKRFADHMTSRGLSPKFYPEKAVQNDDSYSSMRLRKTHDIWHVVAGFDTDIPGELGLQAFYLAQIRTPMAPALLGTMFFRSVFVPEGIDRVMDQIVRGWQMGCVAKSFFAQKWELGWGRPLEEWREELGLTNILHPREAAPPPL